MDLATLLSRGKRNPETGCLEWTGCTQANGYGRIRSDGKTRYVHRAAAELVFGFIPEGADVCHRCDNRRCFEPGHLFIGSRLDNMRDAKTKGRISSGEDHAAAVPHGESSHLAKLREADVLDIRRRYGTGITQSHLAAEFGVDRSLIGQIINRKIWKHI